MSNVLTRDDFYQLRHVRRIRDDLELGDTDYARLRDDEMRRLHWMWTLQFDARSPLTQLHIHPNIIRAPRGDHDD